MEHEQIMQLDPLIHAPIRLAILSVLVSVDLASFAYLKKTVNTSDGNLSTHLAKLEEGGLIVSHKAFVGKKPQTTYRLNEKGRKAFSNYLAQLEKILGMSKGQ